MLELSKMTPEQFRDEITKYDHFDIASMATQMVNARGNNIRKWAIRVYPNHSEVNFSNAVLGNKSELRFWCYVNADKSLIHTSIYKGEEQLKLCLSSTIDVFGSVSWFEEITTALEKQNWI